MMPAAIVSNENSADGRGLRSHPTRKANAGAIRLDRLSESRD